ncbi:MAG: hypothetical protein AB1716_11075, partial [Planctomycetota bacterium]
MGRRVQTIDHRESRTPCGTTVSPLITRHVYGMLDAVAEYIHCESGAGVPACRTAGVPACQRSTWTLARESPHGATGDGRARLLPSRNGRARLPPSRNGRARLLPSRAEPVSLPTRDSLLATRYFPYTALGDNAALGEPEVLHYLHDRLGSVVGLLDAGEPNAQPPVPPALVERY